MKLLLGNEESILGKLAAVGVLQTMFDADVQTAFLAVLDEGDDEVRRAVAEALGLSAKRGDADVGDALLKAIVVEDNDLRRAVAVAMARVASPGTADNLAATLRTDDGKDIVLHDGMVRAWRCSASRASSRSSASPTRACRRTPTSSLRVPRAAVPSRVRRLAGAC